MSAYDCPHERPWAAESDHSLVFDSAVLNEALAIWCEHAAPGCVPPRRAMTRDLNAVQGNTVICERLDDGRYRVCQMGSRIALMVGEKQGAMVDECVPPEMARHWTNAFDLVLTELRPLRFVSLAPVMHIDFLRVEVLLAPLLDEANAPRMVLAVATLKSDTDMRTARSQRLLVIEEQFD